MTIKELIEKLKSFPENAEVKFSYDYGDYWHTRVAQEINNVSEEKVIYSDYHRMDKIANEECSDERNGKEIVILS